MEYLDTLNDQQKEAVLHKEGPLLIVAGAGAGKTKTITHRIAHLIQTGVEPRNILAVTFTNKAAKEMRERVLKLLGEGRPAPLLTTFHSLGVRILREFHTEANLPRGFSIWDRDDSMRAIKKALEKLGIEAYQPKVILSVISRKKGDGVTLDSYSLSTNDFRAQTVSQVWKLYEEALRAEGALDFDDLLSRTLALLNTNNDVLALLQNRWHYITIDEYQDTNHAQYEIVELLAGERKNICVVGDGDQCVYTWRGANVENIMTFEKSFPNTKTVLLEQNYRSTRTILAAANSVIIKNKRRKEKNLYTENVTGDSIGLYHGRNEMDEAWFVSHMAAQMVRDGANPGEIAILYRENFQSRVLEEALLSASVPYHVLGTRFFDRKEVKDILSYIRAALNPQNKLDIERVIAVPPRGIGKVTLDKMLGGEEGSLSGATKVKVQQFRDLMERITHAVNTLPLSEAIRYCIESTGIEAMFKNDKEEGEERLKNVYELVNLAVRYDDMTPPEGAERLLEEAALQADQDNMKDERTSISLMTVHASKGLEFDAVFVTGLEQGLFPSIRENDSGRDTEEERRLFYVAITRARKRLFLTHASQRMKYGNRDFTMPSEFLDDIDERLYKNLSRDQEPRKHERVSFLD